MKNEEKTPLDCAADLLEEHPERWTQYATFEDPDDHRNRTTAAVDPVKDGYDPKTCKVCSIGALIVCGVPPNAFTEQLLGRRARRYADVSHFNDAVAEDGVALIVEAMRSRSEPFDDPRYLKVSE